MPHPPEEWESPREVGMQFPRPEFDPIIPEDLLNKEYRPDPEDIRILLRPPEVILPDLLTIRLQVSRDTEEEATHLLSNLEFLLDGLQNLQIVLCLQDLNREAQ